MVRITNEVLAEKIDNIKVDLHENIIPEVKKNSEFRIKAKGIITGIAFISSTCGAFVFYIINKIWEIKK